MATYTGKETLYEYMKEDIPDGNHTFVLEANGENVSINAEVFNYYTNVTYTEQDSLGSATADSRMLILRYHKNLIIEAGAVFRPKVRKRGMLVWVNGELINNGTISMTARGASAPGQNVYLYKNIDETFEYVPAVGGLGGAAGGYNQNGYKGVDGVGRALGGGGGGGMYGTYTNRAARGGNATSYSGGSGGGGGAAGAGGGSYGTAGSDTGGAGGSGGSSGTYDQGHGGAGNPPGSDFRGTTNLGTNSGQPGTGGLLIIFTKKFINRGLIESRGSDSIGRKVVSAYYNYLGGGGASGGGSINIFYTEIIDNGTYNVSGGTSYQSGGWSNYCLGGNGGNGTVTLTEIYNPFIIEGYLTKTTPWATDSFIYANLSVDHKENGQILYKVFINDTEIETSDYYATPIDLQIPISVDYFNLGNNRLVIRLVDENGIPDSLVFNIIKENEDTFSFVREFNFKEGYITSENIEVIENHGIALKTPGIEFVTIDIPTVHKSKIGSVIADCISDSASPLKKVRFMVLKDDTYYTYNNGWQEADVSIENGMTKQQLEAITAEQWVELEPSWFLHTFAVVIILQSEETGIGLIKKITVNFQEPITVLCDTITLHAPDKGLRNVLIDGEYQLKIMPGIAFDDAEVDYNFYTTPDKIRFRPLNFGQVIGGSYTQIHAVEVINGYDDSDFNVVLFASKNNIAAEERDGYGLLYDSMRDVTRTRIEFSLVPPPNFDPVYPLTFQLDRLSSRIFYVRIKPALTITGDDTFQIRLLGRVV